MMPDIVKCCSKCSLPKLSGEFAKNRYNKDGLQSWCKQCRSECRRAKHSQDPERSREISRAAYRRDIERSRANSRARRLQDPESYRENCRTRRLQNLENYRASHCAFYYRGIAHSRAQKRACQAVRRALLRGDLIKPDRCEACGLLESEVAGGLEAHHYLGYAREHYLDVQWLCVPHHKEAEREKRAIRSTTGGKAESDACFGAEVLRQQDRCRVTAKLDEGGK